MLALVILYYGFIVADRQIDDWRHLFTDRITHFYGHGSIEAACALQLAAILFAVTLWLAGFSRVAVGVLTVAVVGASASHWFTHGPLGVHALLAVGCTVALNLVVCMYLARRLRAWDEPYRSNVLDADGCDQPGNRGGDAPATCSLC